MNRTAQQVLARHPDTHPLIAELESNLDLVCPATNPLEAFASTLPAEERANAFLPIPPPVAVRGKERTALTRRIDNEKCFQHQVKLLSTMSAQRLVARFYFFWMGATRGSQRSARKAAAADLVVPHPPSAHSAVSSAKKKPSAPSSANSRGPNTPINSSIAASGGESSPVVGPALPPTASKPGSASSSTVARLPSLNRRAKHQVEKEPGTPRSNNNMSMPQMAKLTT